MMDFEGGEQMREKWKMVMVMKMKVKMGEWSVDGGGC